MRAVVQRVSRAAVRIDGQVVGEVGRGLLVLLGIGREDTDADSRWLINKLFHLRIFPDVAGKMNRSVTDVAGGLLVVSQFTLYGDVRKGTRPSFTDAMSPPAAERFYEDFMASLRAATTLPVAAGRFAARMAVELVNDGPVTIVLDSASVGHASRMSAAPQQTVGSMPLSYAFVPFDPAQAIEIQTRTLPHWRQQGATYFVTFRLADSLPREKLEQWEHERKAWLREHPAPRSEAERQEYQQQFVDRLECWLDAGYGECLLRRREVAELVEKALRCFDGARYLLGRFVIMPNHVHVLVTPLGEHDLSSIEHSWKSFTAHEIIRLRQRRTSIWQKESFDHIVRNTNKLAEYENYIRQNPALANLPVDSCLGGIGRAGRMGATEPNTRDACSTAADTRDAYPTDG